MLTNVKSMKRNFIYLSIIGGLCFFSCKETEKITAKADLQYTAPQKTDSISKPLPQEIDSSRNNPVTDSLSKKQIVSIEGKYTAKTCEDGRFSIEFEDKGEKIGYKIYDKRKMFASGRVDISVKSNEEYNARMGAIGAILKGDTLTVQNYGNSMNAFDHFGQCTDKYLNFIKVKQHSVKAEKKNKHSM